MNIPRHFTRIGVCAGLAIVCLGLASCSVFGHKDKMASGAQPVIAKDAAPAKDKPDTEPAATTEKPHRKWYKFGWLPFVGHKDKPVAEMEPVVPKEAPVPKAKPVAEMEPVVPKQTPAPKAKPAEEAKPAQAKEEQKHKWYKFGWLPFVGHKEKATPEGKPVATKEAPPAKQKAAPAPEPAPVKEAPAPKAKPAEEAKPAPVKEKPAPKAKPAEEAKPTQAKEEHKQRWYKFGWLPFVGHKEKPAPAEKPVAAKETPHAKPKPAPAPIPEAPPVKEGPSGKDYEAVLAKTVRAAIQATDSTTDEQRNKVIRHKPYFYKEYSVYTDGPDSFKILLQEKEQKSAPYIADVTIPKQRFATRLHRKRGEAEADKNFLRDTGTETITYEVRNGRWVRVASIFVADKSDEKINGEWVPVKATVKRTLPGEEENAKGPLRRAWSKFFGY